MTLKGMREVSFLFLDQGAEVLRDRTSSSNLLALPVNLGLRVIYLIAEKMYQGETRWSLQYPRCCAKFFLK